MKKPRVIYVDIDETICDTPSKDGARDYENSVPDKVMIEAINKLYNAGNTIIYWKARGSCTGKDWHKFTFKQLDNWGCLFHKLKCDKPYYDIFIEDKSIHPKDIKECISSNAIANAQISATIKELELLCSGIF